MGKSEPFLFKTNFFALLADKRKTLSCLLENCKFLAVVKQLRRFELSKFFHKA